MVFWSLVFLFDRCNTLDIFGTFCIFSMVLLPPFLWPMDCKARSLLVKGSLNVRYWYKYELFNQHFGYCWPIYKWWLVSWHKLALILMNPSLLNASIIIVFASILLLALSARNFANWGRWWTKNTHFGKKWQFFMRMEYTIFVEPLSLFFASFPSVEYNPMDPCFLTKK